MAHIVFYEKPGCGGNARQRALLEDAGHTLDRRSLLDGPWEASTLLAFLGSRPVGDWFNRASPRIKGGEVVPERLGRDEAIALLIADPLLIRRPLMRRDDGATLVGFEVDEVERFVGLAPSAAGRPRSLEGCAARAASDPAPEDSSGCGCSAPAEAQRPEDTRLEPLPSESGPPAQIVHSLQEALRPDEAVRTVAPSHDLDFPPVPFPSLRVLRATGQPMLRTLVARHHLLLRASPIGALLPADDTVFARLVDRVTDFVIEACGGPAAYSTEHGFTCMRTRHLPFTIDEAAREHWLDALWQAMHDVAFPEEAREEYWAWLEAMSVRMVNRRTTRAQPRRHSYADMRRRAAGAGVAEAPVEVRTC